MATIAETFNIDKYMQYDGELFKSTHTSKTLCMYKITFTDRSSVKVIMTTKQRDCIHRRKDFDKIALIGGLGYVSRKTQWLVAGFEVNLIDSEYIATHWKTKRQVKASEFKQCLLLIDGYYREQNKIADASVPQ